MARFHEEVERLEQPENLMIHSLAEFRIIQVLKIETNQIGGTPRELTETRVRTSNHRLLWQVEDTAAAV